MLTTGMELAGERGLYRLLTSIAKGGMSEIWLARVADGFAAGEMVVIKQLLPHLVNNPMYAEIFLDEANLTSRFDHPNVVRIHDVDTSQAGHFLVMEYLEGESLGYVTQAANKRDRPVPPHIVAGIMAQACDALAYAHALDDPDGTPLDIIHRDVSPENIIVLYSGRVKLVDFGIAKASGRLHETHTGVQKGKPSYMSPEQALGKKMDPRSDIFSLGVVLWEMLARHRLFKRTVAGASGAEAPIEIMREIAYGEVQPVRVFQPRVSSILESVAMRALAKQPRDRFVDATEMGQALRGYLQGSEQPGDKQAIAAFLVSVLPERLQAKRDLLREAGQAGEPAATGEVLKPGSGDFPDVWAEDEEPDTAVVDPPKNRFTEGDTDVSLAERPFLPEEIAGADPPGDTDEYADTSRYQVESGNPADGTTVVDNEKATVEEKVEDKPAPGSNTATATGEDDDSADDDSADDDGAIDDGVNDDAEIATVEAPPHRRPYLRDEAGTPASKEQPPARFEPVSPGEPANGQQEPRRSRLRLLLVVLVVSAVAAVVWILWPAEQKTSPDGSGTVHDAPAADLAPVQLEIRSEPAGCTAQLDGEALPGQTPMTGVNAVPGRLHQVTIACRRHKRESRSFQGEPGERVVLEFRPVHRPVRRPGTLRLNSEPWTAVYLGKKKLGVTPLLDHKLPSGTHTLTLRNREMGIDTRITVKIRPGQTTSVLKKFEQR